MLQTLPDVTFTFDASLTPLLVSVSPSRGSTEGGTQLTLSGNFPVSPAGNLSVSLGEVPCEDAQLLNANTITCTTAHPTGGNASLPKPQGPQPVRVVCSDWGNSACNGTARGVNGSAGGCGYQFVDLWSRKTTWGGGEPPAEGDTVMVPGELCVRCLRVHSRASSSMSPTATLHEVFDLCMTADCVVVVWCRQHHCAA